MNNFWQFLNNHSEGLGVLLILLAVFGFLSFIAYISR